MASNPVHSAKRTKLKNWESFNVYEEILHEGQFTINTHWAVTEKPSEGRKIVKARLIARGFEENLETRVTEIIPGNYVYNSLGGQNDKHLRGFPMRK